MKIIMMAHTINENGAHVPGDVVDLSDAVAATYIKKGWAKPYREKKEVKAAPVIETPEDHTSRASRQETATLKPRKSRS